MWAQSYRQTSLCPSIIFALLTPWDYFWAAFPVGHHAWMFFLVAGLRQVAERCGPALAQDRACLAFGAGCIAIVRGGARRIGRARHVRDRLLLIYRHGEP